MADGARFISILYLVCNKHKGRCDRVCLAFGLGSLSFGGRPFR